MDRDPQNLEARKDPVFLFQTEDIFLIKIPEWLEIKDEQYFISNKVPWVPRWVIKHIDKDGFVLGESAFLHELKQFDQDKNTITTWNTRGVFLTRGEAENYAENQKYNYPHWRVYCIPCYGKLADILNKYEPKTGMVANA